MRRLATVRIENVKGIDILEIKPGAVTIIQGENGCGKSSVLEAIAAVFEGGHDPELIRQGQKKARIALGLDDGTQITKTITKSTSNVEIVAPDGLPVKRPAEYLADLAKGIGFDPVQFIQAKPKDRAAFVMRAMPMTITKAEVQAAMDKAHVQGVTVQGDMDLSGLNAFRQRVFDLRTDVNRARVQAEHTEDSLRKSLPPEPEGGDWERALAGAREVLQARIDARNVSQNEAEAAYKAAIVSVNEEFERRLAELNAWREQERERARSDDRTRQADIALAHSQGIEDAQAEFTRIEEQKAAADRAKGAREMLREAEKLAAEKTVEHDRLCWALENIDALKLSKIRELPIDGLMVEDGELVYNGIPFDKVNTAQQILLAVQLASLAVKDLGLMVLDRAESLDEQTWAAFVEAFTESGLQVIAARVTDGARKVTVAA
jgi:energy-coupling factor transporter ATP-binding protein EcfA2